MAIASHRGREDLTRDHIAIRRDRIPERIETFEFGVNPYILRVECPGRETPEAKQRQDRPENNAH